MARESNETKVRSPVIKSSVLPRFFQSSPSIEHKWRISPSSPADYNRRDRSVIATFHHRVDRSVVHHSLDWSRDLRFRRANNGEKKGGRQCGKISRDETRMIKGGESAVTKHLREISPTGACVNSHRAISAEFDLVARRMVIIFSRILIEFSFNHLRFTFILHIYYQLSAWLKIFQATSGCWLNVSSWIYRGTSDLHYINATVKL